MDIARVDHMWCLKFCHEARTHTAQTAQAALAADHYWQTDILSQHIFGTDIIDRSQQRRQTDWQQTEREINVTGAPTLEMSTQSGILPNWSQPTAIGEWHMANVIREWLCQLTPNDVSDRMTCLSFAHLCLWCSLASYLEINWNQLKLYFTSSKS